MNKLYNDDIISFLNNNVEDNSANLIIADPPYNILPESWDTFKSNEDYFEFMTSWIKLSYKKLAVGGTIYLFNNAYNSAKLIPILEECGFIFRDWIIWFKKDGLAYSKKKYVNNQEVILFFTKGNNYCFNVDPVRVPYLSSKRMKHAEKMGILKDGKRWFPNEKGKLCSNVWEFPSERHNNKVNGKVVKHFHPTPKPEKLIERMILASSNENDLVLDLFSGSGTSTLSSISCKRRSKGCELDKHFYGSAIERIKNRHSYWRNE